MDPAITISDDYDPLNDAALANPYETREDEPSGRRGRDREDSPDGDDRGRDRRESKGQGLDRSRSRSPRRADVANGSCQDSRSDTTVVKCRGLPYSASERDIRDFFEGCAIERDGRLMAVCWDLSFQRA